MSNFLISHSFCSKSFNNSLYCFAPEELYLINEVGENLPINRFLHRHNRAFSTEFPLYRLSSSERLQYVRDSIVSTTEFDIELHRRIFPLALFQSHRLFLPRKDPSFISSLLFELILFWKSYLINNKISFYFAWKIPHQLSDFVLYEVASSYLAKASWIYASTMGVDLSFSGSFSSKPTFSPLSNTSKLISLSSATHDLIQSYKQRILKRHKPFLVYDQIVSYLDSTCFSAPGANLYNITYSQYISDYLSDQDSKLYLDSINFSYTNSFLDAPPEGSIVILLNQEPEATINPLAYPFDSLLTFISIIRSNVPSDVPIFLKEHPHAYQPSHTWSNSPLPASIHFRGSLFWDTIKELKNTFYVGPWVSGDWLFHGHYVPVTLGSTLTFEYPLLGRHVICFGYLNQTLSQMSDFIHSPPIDKLYDTICDLLNVQNTNKTDSLSKFPWIPLSHLASTDPHQASNLSTLLSCLILDDNLP